MKHAESIDFPLTVFLQFPAQRENSSSKFKHKRLINGLNMPKVGNKETHRCLLRLLWCLYC